MSNMSRGRKDIDANKKIKMKGRKSTTRGQLGGRRSRIDRALEAAEGKNTGASSQDDVKHKTFTNKSGNTENKTG